MNNKLFGLGLALFLLASCAEPTPTMIVEAQPTAISTSAPPTSTSTPLPTIYLSDLEPIFESVGHATLGRGVNTWSDIGPVGQAINASGKSYRHGLLAHAPSLIEYSLDGRFRTLETSMLMHPDGRCGDGAIFQILVDSDLIYSSPTLTYASDPEQVIMNLTGGQLLTLKIKEGKTADCDWSIWGDPILTVAEGLSLPQTATPFPLRTETVLQSDASPVIEPHVWAIYYPWYMESFYPRAWSSDIWTDRPLTPYESNNPAGIRQHIEWAKSAGIDGFLVEWCGIGRAGDNDVIDDNLGIVLDVAAELDFKIAAYYDRLCIHETEIEPLKNQLEYLLTIHAQHPAYYWMNGKPVVVMYNTNEISPGHWTNIFDSLKEEGLSAIYVGDTYDGSQLSVFNGLHTYINVMDGNTSRAYADLERSVDNARQMLPNQEFFWAATVSPGFDSTPIYLGRDHLNPGMQKSDILIVNRNDSQTYKNQWDAAIQSGADWIIITSWNEWQENTHIEPSQMYGDAYLLLTKSFIELWKSLLQ